MSMMLRTAYSLLGDGNGNEWDENEEYTRAITELVRDTLGLPEFIDAGSDEARAFVLGMIYGSVGQEG